MERDFRACRLIAGQLILTEPSPALCQFSGIGGWSHRTQLPGKTLPRDSNLFPLPSVDRAVGPAGGAASARTNGHAAEPDSQRAGVKRHGLAVASYSKWIKLRRQNTGPFRAAHLAPFDAVHLAIGHQKESWISAQFALKDEFSRCFTRGDGLLAHQRVGRPRGKQLEITARQAYLTRAAESMREKFLRPSCRACHRQWLS